MSPDRVLRRMELRNDRGQSVDPVPFIVMTGVAFTVCYSYGPIYFVSLGWTMPSAVGTSTGAFLAATAVAFYRLVWTARPDLRGEIPASMRLRRLFLATVAAVVALFGLSLPLLIR